MAEKEGVDKYNILDMHYERLCAERAESAPFPSYYPEWIIPAMDEYASLLLEKYIMSSEHTGSYDLVKQRVANFMEKLTHPAIGTATQAIDERHPGDNDQDVKEMLALTIDKYNEFMRKRYRKSIGALEQCECCGRLVIGGKCICDSKPKEEFKNVAGDTEPASLVKETVVPIIVALAEKQDVARMPSIYMEAPHAIIIDMGMKEPLAQLNARLAEGWKIRHSIASPVFDKKCEARHIVILDRND